MILVEMILVEMILVEMILSGDGDGTDNELQPDPSPCIEDPNAEGCNEDPCIEDPTLEGCEDPCIEDPTLEGCEDPCYRRDPTLEGCEDPCIEDPTLEGCEPSVDCEPSYPEHLCTTPSRQPSTAMISLTVISKS